MQQGVVEKFVGMLQVVEHEGKSVDLIQDRTHESRVFRDEGDWTHPLCLHVQNIFGFWDICVDCYPFNTAAGEFRGGHENYEFEISYWDVWGTDMPRDNQVAGFAIVIWDEGFGFPAVYWWGSPFVDPDVPDTWGHIIIPEFPIPVMAAGAAIAVLGLRRRSPRRGSRNQENS